MSAAEVVDVVERSGMALGPSARRSDGQGRRSKAPGRRARGPLRLTTAQLLVLGAALMALGLAGWFVLYLTVLSGAVESHSQSSLYAQLRQQLADGTAPLGGSVDEGAPVALLSLPSSGIDDLVVVEGTSSGDLMAGPGHRRDTVLPGQVGVSVVYGRGLSFGAPFGAAPGTTVGRTLTVTTGQGVFRYRVERVRHVGDPLPAQLAAGASRLTLVTTEPDGTGPWARWAPQSEVYVDAALTGRAQPRQAQPAAVPAPEQAMQGDPGALPVALLWLQALLIALGLGIWAWFRWGRPQTWLLAGSVAFAALWGLSGAVAQLLPNLL